MYHRLTRPPPVCQRTSAIPVAIEVIDRRDVGAARILPDRLCGQHLAAIHLPHTDEPLVGMPGDVARAVAIEIAKVRDVVAGRRLGDPRPPQ